MRKGPRMRKGGWAEGRGPSLQSPRRWAEEVNDGSRGPGAGRGVRAGGEQREREERERGREERERARQERERGQAGEANGPTDPRPRGWAEDAGKGARWAGR